MNDAETEIQAECKEPWRTKTVIYPKRRATRNRLPRWSRAKMSPGGEIQRDKTASLFNWYNAVSHPRGETARMQYSFACSLVGTTLTEAETSCEVLSTASIPWGTEVTPGAAVPELLPFITSPGEALSPESCEQGCSFTPQTVKTNTSPLSQLRLWIFFFFLS